MLCPWEWTHGLSRLNRQTDKNLLNSLSWKWHSSKKASVKWLFNQAEIWIWTSKKYGTHEWNREMEKSLSSYWKKQIKGIRWPKKFDGITKEEYDRSRNQISYNPVPKLAISVGKLNKKRKGNAW